MRKSDTSVCWLLDAAALKPVYEIMEGEVLWIS